MNLNSSLIKLKGFFTKNIKETLSNDEGKKNLFFDYTRRYYIKFSIDVSTTCQNIYRIHKEEIKKNIDKIYANQNINIDLFGFVIIELNSNRFEKMQNLTNVKLRMDDNILFRVLSNAHMMLCFMYITRHNIILKKNVRNYGIAHLRTPQITIGRKNQIEKNKKDIIIYYQKNTIFYYNNNAYSFSKEKMQISEEEIFISSKPNNKLFIKDIKSNTSFISSDKNSAQFFKNYKIYGELPLFCLEIETKDNKRLLIGKNNIEQIKIIQRALDKAICNYQNHYLTLYLEKKLLEQNNNVFSVSYQLMEKGSFLSDLVINKEKRDSIFPNIKRNYLDEIINYILEFKTCLRKKKYLDCIAKIKQITNILDYIQKEENNNLKIISEKNIKYIKGIWEQINIFFKLKKMNKEDTNSKDNTDIQQSINNDDENTKIIDDKGEEDIGKNSNGTKDDCQTILGRKFINNFNIIIESVDKLNDFKNIINKNIFDNIYFEIKKKIIKNIYEKNKNENDKLTDIKIFSNDKLILGNCFINNFEMKNEQDFYCIGAEDYQKKIKNLNKETIIENGGELRSF